MKRLALLLILFAVPAQAWTRKPLFQVVPGSPFTGGGGGGAPSFPLLAPNGSYAAPSYSFSSFPNAGLIYDSSLGYIVLEGANASGTDIAGGNMSLNVGRGTGTGAAGLFAVSLGPRGSASGSSVNAGQNVLLFNDTNSTVGALQTHTVGGTQTYSAYSRPAGDTDAAGNSMLILGGQSTGTGAGGNITLQLSTPAAGTGSTQNALQNVIQALGSTGEILLTPGITGAGVRGPLSFTAAGTSLQLDRTITAAGTTGARTIDKMAGCVNFAAAATTLVVTNAQATANSIIMANAMTNDTTCHVKDVERAAGSFTIRVTAACTAETAVCFWLTN